MRRVARVCVLLGAAVAVACQAAGGARPRGGDDPEPAATTPEPPAATAPAVTPARDAAAPAAVDADVPGPRPDAPAAAADRAVPRDVAAAADLPALPATAGCAGIALCDDFEAQTVGGAPAGIWKTSVSNGTLIVDRTRAFSGQNAVMATVDPRSGARSFLRLTKPYLPLATNNMYGRMMFWVNAIPTSRVHWFNVWASGKLATGQTANYAIGGLDTGILLNYFPGDCWRNSVPFPAGRWACFQWQFDGSPGADGAPKDEMRAWIDGKLIGTVVRTGAGCENIPGKSEWFAPTFDDLLIGWQYAAGNQIQMWMDDVAVDTKPIPCVARP
jgi:hypothetical protein